MSSLVQIRIAGDLKQLLTRLKQRVQTLLSLEARAAHKLGLTPNRVSAIGLALVFLSALAYSRWQTDRLYLILAVVLLLLSSFCDALDGVIARLYQQATPFGGFLDSLLDRYADAAIYAAMIISGLCDLLWGLIALIGSLLVSYSRARAEALGIKMEAIGIAERAERVIIIAVASAIAAFWQPATTIMKAAIILLAVLTNLTVLQRAVHTYGRLKKE
jgi:archaetidylinositol phosphate synthase